MAAIDDSGATAAPNFVRQFQPNYPMGWTDRSAALSFLHVSVMTPGYVPKMAFIDRKGILRFQVFGEDPYFGEASRDKNIRATLEGMVGDETKGQRTKSKRPPARK